MDNESLSTAEKLEALIRKAEITPSVSFATGDYAAMNAVTVANAVKDYCEYLLAERLTNIFLFDHRVARALFGEGYIMQYIEGIPIWVNGWQYYLQQAVILPTPAEQVDYMHQIVFGGSDV